MSVICIIDLHCTTLKQLYCFRRGHIESVIDQRITKYISPIVTVYQELIIC